MRALYCTCWRTRYRLYDSLDACAAAALPMGFEIGVNFRHSPGGMTWDAHRLDSLDEIRAMLKATEDGARQDIVGEKVCGGGPFIVIFKQGAWRYGHSVTPEKI